jgi:hypothetical protein
MPFRPNSKNGYFCAAAMVLALALNSAAAEAHSRGGNGGRDGRGDREDRNFYNNTYNKPSTVTTEPKEQIAPAEPVPTKATDPYDMGGGTPIKTPVKDSDSANPLLVKYQLQNSGYSTEQAQAEYFAKVAEYYKRASAKTLALGVVATAEGLGQMAANGTKIGDGGTLVAAGLKSLEAGEQMKLSEQEVMSKIQAEASAKELDEELMADPLAEEVIEHLVKTTGYSRAEAIEKILNSRGDLDALAAEFESAAQGKEQIDLAKQTSEADLTGIIEASKSGALRRKINFASLREALTTSATLAKKAPPADWKKQWASLATAQPARNVSAGSAQPAATRAPASQPEFLNLGENLPSFELEESQSEEAYETSLFEKVHRKYAEIAPSMRRLKGK